MNRSPNISPNLSSNMARLREHFPALRGPDMGDRKRVIAETAALMLPLLAEALFGTGISPAPADVKEG